MAKVMRQYACLHSHSTHSDGVYTPEELVKIASDEGYGALAVTDHDTVTANAPLASYAKEYGLDCLFGVEFSTKCKHNGMGYHLTAFDFDESYPEMRDYLNKLSAKETHQTQELFKRGVEIGYIHDITWDEVLSYNTGISWLCNEHVFRAMKAKGLCTDKDYPEFFATCYGPYRSTVEPLYSFKSTEEVIDLVHMAGGIAVIAHPFLNVNNADKTLNCFDYFHSLGIDGIEVWHPDQSARWRRIALELALKYDLYVSGGADHAGLLGGQYERFSNPEETEYFFPSLTLGTTEYFFDEIKKKSKSHDRREHISALLADSSLWQMTGGIIDKRDTR